MRFREQKMLIGRKQPRGIGCANLNIIIHERGTSAAEYVPTEFLVFLMLFLLFFGQNTIKVEVNVKGEATAHHTRSHRRHRRDLATIKRCAKPSPSGAQPAPLAVNHMPEPPARIQMAPQSAGDDMFRPSALLLLPSLGTEHASQAPGL